LLGRWCCRRLLLAAEAVPERVVAVLSLLLLLLLLRGRCLWLPVRIGSGHGCRCVETEKVRDGCRRGGCSVATTTAATVVQVLHAGELGRRNGLPLRGREIGIVLVVVAVVATAVVSPPGLSLSLDGTDDHRRRSELKYLWHGKVGNTVETDVEGTDVGNVPVGRLGDEMGPQRSDQTRDLELEVVLKDLVGRPSVLSRFGIVDVLPVADDLALSAVERPGEDDLVFAAAAIGSGLTVRNGGGLAMPNLKMIFFLEKPKVLEVFLTA